jgi:GNAT superfamily N-acetyltransferase
MSLRIELLAARHQRGEFNCGNAELNQFLNQQAGQLARKNFSKTYVAVADDGIMVLGFVSVSVGQIQTLRMSEQSNLPRYPVPVLRIGRLAVDQRQQGRGIGQRLMAFSLRMAVGFSQQVGLYAVVVDAKHAQASQFYTTLGFTPTLDNPLCLYLPMATLLKLKQEP